MTKPSKSELEQQVIVGAREYGIGSVLFRHAIGEILHLSVTDMECLGIIYFKGIIKPTQLAEYTGLTSGATTTMLDRLETAGLIERRPNPQDGRSTFIVPTRNKTTEKVGKLFASARHAQSKIVSSYSAQELNLLANFFSRSVQMWEDERKKLHAR